MSRFTKTKLNNFSKNKKLGRIKFGSAALNFLIMGIISVIGALYLVQVNKTATYGFMARDLEKELNKLSQENKALEMQAAGLQSMDKAEEMGRELKMVKINRVDYILPASTSMAAR